MRKIGERSCFLERPKVEKTLIIAKEMKSGPHRGIGPQRTRGRGRSESVCKQPSMLPQATCPPSNTIYIVIWYYRDSMVVRPNDLLRRSEKE